MIKNKIEVILLANVCTTEYDFIGKKLAKKLYYFLEIKF